MKFNSVLMAACTFGAFVVALPAPAPAIDNGLDVLEKAELIPREPVPSLEERTNKPNFALDVQLCIDSIASINAKFNKKKAYSPADCKTWASEVTVPVKKLISTIAAYPKNTVFPSATVCASMLAKLLCAIFVQLKCFMDKGSGIASTVLKNVDLLSSTLLGRVGDLLKSCVSLCSLLNAKVSVGVSAKAISGCGGIIDPTYLKALVKQLRSAGVSC